MMVEDYDGAELVDSAGERIGTVERSYVDDRGAVRFVEVKIRGLRAKHRLVPMDQAERTDGALKVPFSKDMVEASPDASSAGDTLEGGTLDEVRAYYAREGGQGAGSGEGSAAVPVNEAQPPNTSRSESDSEDGMGV